MKLIIYFIWFVYKKNNKFIILINRELNKLGWRSIYDNIMLIIIYEMFVFLWIIYYLDSVVDV